MRRWANALLLIFLLVELASGFFGLTSGSEDRAIHMQAHRVAGYGILAILIWKTAIVMRSLRRPRKVAVRAPSVLLAALLIATLALGLAWSLAGPYDWWLFSGVSWHIYVGAALVVPLAWHALHMARESRIAFSPRRRLLMRAGGVALAGFIGWRLSEGVASAAGWSGSARRFTGSYEAARYSGNAFPVVSWLNDSPAPIDAGAWRLTVRGMVERPLSLTLDDLSEDAALDATIDCTGGWHATQTWRGVPLEALLRKAGMNPAARSVTVRSVTGYYRRFSPDAARGFLLASHVGDERLSHGHGFPLRLVARERRGFEWVKWVTDIEISETPAWLQPPLPVQ